MSQLGIRFLCLVMITHRLGRIPMSDANGFFDSVVDFGNSIGDVMDDVMTKAEFVFHTFKTLDNVLTDAIEEECEFLCPNGNKPIPNPRATPNPNGCGSMGLNIDTSMLPSEELSKCCDKHDICYDTCNREKDSCDKKFKKCLYALCNENKKSYGERFHMSCKVAAKLMYTSTIAIGCRSYKDAQADACLCNASKHPDL